MLVSGSAAFPPTMGQESSTPCWEEWPQWMNMPNRAVSNQVIGGFCPLRGGGTNCSNTEAPSHQVTQSLRQLLRVEAEERRWFEAELPQVLAQLAAVMRLVFDEPAHHPAPGRERFADSLRDELLQVGIDE